MKMWPPHWPPQTAAARNAPGSVAFGHLIYVFCRLLITVTFIVFVNEADGFVGRRLLNDSLILPTLATFASRDLNQRASIPIVQGDMFPNI